MTSLKFGTDAFCKFRQHHHVMPVNQQQFKPRPNTRTPYVYLFTSLHVSVVPFCHHQVENTRKLQEQCAVQETMLLY